MEAKLKQYFPIIRERKEVLAEIGSREDLKVKFEKWSSEQQNEFLDLVTGVKGLKLLRDGFFKGIMNPGRMDDFLSHMLKQKVKVLKVLPVDSTRIADESSLVIMDIVVELEDGSLANVEMQRVGYLFPGQRSACYSADLLLRQYKRVRDEKKKKFSYRDIKNVYTIVLYEKSPKEFKGFPEHYYHYFEQKSDTGIELELLQKYLFIPLDIYQKNQHNKNIKDKRNAWLALLSGEDAEQIIALTEEYPEFKEIYREAYEICCNVEEVMGMFSKELYELDKNTEQYMMDEMQSEIDEMQSTINVQNNIIEKSIINTINMMKKMKMSDNEILDNIKEQYQLSKEQAQKYLI